jgi:hypothetical protein
MVLGKGGFGKPRRGGDFSCVNVLLHTFRQLFLLTPRKPLVCVCVHGAWEGVHARTRVCVCVCVCREVREGVRSGFRVKGTCPRRTLGY